MLDARRIPDDVRRPDIPSDCRELQSLKNKGYVLKPATDPDWLLKGIRFESVDLSHEGTHGPAAKLYAFQEDAHVKRSGPIRIWKIEVLKAR